MEFEPDVLLVVKIPEAGDHGIVPFIGLVTIPMVEFLIGGGVDFLFELEFVEHVSLVLVSKSVLVLDGDTKLSPFADHVDDVRGEPVVGVDLLLDEAVLVEILIQHLPYVLLLEVFLGSVVHALN